MNIPHANRNRRPNQHYRNNQDIRWNELFEGAVAGAVMLKVFQKHPFLSTVGFAATGYVFFKNR